MPIGPFPVGIAKANPLTHNVFVQGPSEGMNFPPGIQGITTESSIFIITEDSKILLTED